MQKIIKKSNGVSFALDRLEALGGELIEWTETIARMENEGVRKSNDFIEITLRLFSVDGCNHGDRV